MASADYHINTDKYADGTDKPRVIRAAEIQIIFLGQLGIKINRIFRAPPINYNFKLREQYELKKFFII